MHRLFMLAAIIILSAGPAGAFVNGSGTYVVRGDRGGNVASYLIKARALRAESVKIRFAGGCDSACTLLLSHPGRDVCITRGARFGFHLPYGGRPHDNERVRQRLMAAYPGWVRQWIAARGGLSSSLKTMDYGYASRFLKTCA